MSRYCGKHETKAIFAAAEHWKGQALLHGGSVFVDEPLWTSENIDFIRSHFVARPDVGAGVFLDKLKEQLAPTPAATKKLAAEMMWLLYLCPSNLTIRHKRQVVDEVWSWSDAPLPDTEWLADAVLSGIGSGGPGFNQNQWRELAFLTNFVRAFRKLKEDEATRLISEPRAFDEWLKNVSEWETRQFRHMLLFLMFPDEFERAFGQHDRKAIVQAFTAANGRTLNAMNPLELDRALREVRRKVESEYPATELDFYTTPLVELWKQTDVIGVASGMTAEHVRQALAQIDREGTPASAQSTGYDLVEGGRRYPPKLVFSLAAKYATGRELDRNYFSGGQDSQAHRVLQGLGFEISTKDLITPLITKFLEQAKTGSELKVQGYLEEYRGLKVRVSFGQGNFARIPWIAFLGKAQAVSEGVYPVFLLFREQGVLLLCYGISETKEPESSWRDIRGDAPTVKEWFRSRYARLPERYGQSLVRNAYQLDKELPMAELKQELDAMIDQYEAMLGDADNLTLPLEADLVRASIGDASRAFSGALRNSFVNFGVHHEHLVASFIASLATKPLVILTGLSGSGKTQLAIRLGEWIGEGRLHVAAVRPDWTGAEALFGYEDGLKPALGGRAAWVVPAPLEFILSAADDPSHPYLLLLDEMNLAHVERYFADVLSGMESRQPCLPNLIRGADGIWRVRVQGPALIAFPRNVWIVGTVNVDETTYMFSPKVLDRASTFEFRVHATDLNGTLQKPMRCEPGEPALVRGLLSIARDDAWHLEHASPFQVEVEQRLKQLHLVLARRGFEFGHRAFYESLRFSALASEAGLVGLEGVLDRVLLQKILPRLHGSRRRLELPLLALARFCHALPDDVEPDDKLPALAPELAPVSQARLPLSFEKICRLLANLRANQFASFTE